MTENILRKEEKTVYQLRSLYEAYGYKKYKMSKFEEYDLYADNRAFLAGGNVITFNDTHGKLLALKPDVTLSIVKNAADATVHKEYYSENVYRTINGEYKEIMQVGLESIGENDLYSTCEVIMLARKSLEAISDRYILDLSNAAFVAGVFEGHDVPYDVREKLVSCVAERNSHDIEKICALCGVDRDVKERLAAIAGLYGPVEDVIDDARALACNGTMSGALDELWAIYGFMKAIGEGENIRLDLSLINDMSYYDGITFRGFIDGVPAAILSGGRYDKLLTKMGKTMGAIGFAVYMDMLDLYFDDAREYDVDVLVTYGDDTDIVAMTKTVNTILGGNKTVRIQKNADNVRFREHYRYVKGGLEVAKA